MPKTIKRVLIYRLGSLGDTVVALPVYHLVERAFPGAERRLLTNFPVMGKAAAAQAVLQGSGLVDGYLSYPVGTRNPLQLLLLWWKIALWNPQVLVYLAPARGVGTARRDAKFFRLCGIMRQIGVPVTDDLQNSHWDAEAEWLEPEYARLARTVAELGGAETDRDASWDLRLTAAETAKAERLLVAAEGRPILAISVGTKMPANHWGLENWRGCVAELASLLVGFVVVFIGAAEERGACEQLAAAWVGAGGANAINLCGEVTPRESAACLMRARLFMGHDSGPVHLAAACGVQCVAVYSARCFQGQWFPRGTQHRVLYHAVSCRGCLLEECTVEQMRCIRSIQVSEVVEEVRAALGISAGSEREALPVLQAIGEKSARRVHAS
jgi:heptosyltransferase-3